MKQLCRGANVGKAKLWQSLQWQTHTMCIYICTSVSMNWTPIFSLSVNEEQFLLQENVFAANTACNYKSCCWKSGQQPFLPVSLSLLFSWSAASERKRFILILKFNIWLWCKWRAKLKDICTFQHTTRIVDFSFLFTKTSNSWSGCFSFRWTKSDMLEISEIKCIISKMNLTWHQSGFRAPLIYNENAATHRSHTFWKDEASAEQKGHVLQVSSVTFSWITLTVADPFLSCY